MKEINSIAKDLGEIINHNYKNDSDYLEDNHLSEKGIKECNKDKNFFESLMATLNYPIKDKILFDQLYMLDKKSGNNMMGYMNDKARNLSKVFGINFKNCKSLLKNNDNNFYKVKFLLYSLGFEEVYFNYYSISDFPGFKFILTYELGKNLYNYLNNNLKNITKKEDDELYLFKEYFLKDNKFDSELFSELGKNDMLLGLDEFKKGFIEEQGNNISSILETLNNIPSDKLVNESYKLFDIITKPNEPEKTIKWYLNGGGESNNIGTSDEVINKSNELFNDITNPETNNEKLITLSYELGKNISWCLSGGDSDSKYYEDTNKFINAFIEENKFKDKVFGTLFERGYIEGSLDDFIRGFEESKENKDILKSLKKYKENLDIAKDFIKSVKKGK